MAKQDKTPLSLKATSGARFLKEKGHDVPASLVAEMLARLDGFGSYAAYRASLAPATALAVPRTRTLRLIYEPNLAHGKEWFIIPREMDELYEASSAYEVMRALRGTPVFDDLEALDGLMANLSDLGLNGAKVQLSQVFSVAPSTSRYGMPPLGWLLQEPCFELGANTSAAQAASEWEGLTDVYDTGDDSGGALVVEVQVTEETFRFAQDFQRSLYRATAADLALEIRERAKRHGFNPDLEAVIREEHDGKFVDLPGFFEQVRSV